MKEKIAIITGADGAMGREITKAISKAGYHVIMACLDINVATQIHEEIKRESSQEISLLPLNLADYQSIENFVKIIKSQYSSVDLLINNAGVLSSTPRNSVHNIELCTAVIYMGHYLLTHKLYPLMHQGTRILNTVSLTYKYGTIDDTFLMPANVADYNRFKKYGNAKTALYYMSLDLAEKGKESNITSNCCDPGLVSTPIIRMDNKIIDKLCDIFFRPFIKTPAQGAATAIDAALNPDWENVSGQCFANKKVTKIKRRLKKIEQRELLRKITQQIMEKNNFTI